MFEFKNRHAVMNQYQLAIPRVRAKHDFYFRSELLNAVCWALDLRSDRSCSTGFGIEPTWETRDGLDGVIKESEGEPCYGGRMPAEYNADVVGVHCVQLERVLVYSRKWSRCVLHHICAQGNRKRLVDRRR